MLILDFPVLQESSGDFIDTVTYEVMADRKAENLIVTHTLKGSSYIDKLVQSGCAKFSVRLLYRDGAERYHHDCDTHDCHTTDEIIAKQVIPIKFSYAPEVMPSIILLEDQKITIDVASGLTDFWGIGKKISIPKYSRIAIDSNLVFTSGDVSHLMDVMLNDKLKDGEMEVTVNDDAGEGAKPVSLYCGKGVFDELQKVSHSQPTNAIQSMRSAIVTQALCSVYAHIKERVEVSKGDYRPGGVLAAHLQFMENETSEDWTGENFNPSLAATKMWPYHTSVLRDGDIDD